VAGDDAEIGRLEGGRAQGAVLYRYNHRFEPHFVRMRELIGSARLARLHCRCSTATHRAAGARFRMARSRAGVLPILDRIFSTRPFLVRNVGTILA